MKNNPKICYVAGPGQVIKAHHYWKNGIKYPNEFAITYSSQVEQYCCDKDVKVLIISQNPKPDYIEDGNIIIQNIAKPFHNPRGLLYLINQFLYGINLMFRIIKFRSDVVLVNSGSTFYFMLAFLKLFSIKIIPVYHNLLWPKGHYPQKRLAKIILWLDGQLLKYGTHAVIGVSLECSRQVSQISNGQPPPFYLLKPQYLKDEFEGVLPPSPPQEGAFNIIFVGRVIEIKGIFKIIKIASELEKKMPGRIKWDICGDGKDLEQMKKMSSQLRLEGIIKFHGWTNSSQQKEIYKNAHLSIVPTKNNTAEGLAKTAIEAVLYKRPVILSSVVPACEEIGDAAVIVEDNDIYSYATQIANLIEDEGYYKEKVKACTRSMQSYWDGKFGYYAVLSKILDEQS